MVSTSPKTDMETRKVARALYDFMETSRNLEIENEQLKEMLRGWVIDQKYSPEALKRIKATLGER